MARHAYLIANPASDAGNTAGIVNAVRAEFAVRGVQTTLSLTTGTGDATVFAAAARDAGEELVVAIGGDGTISEVVNGLVDPGVPDGAGPALAVIERGTGCDFIRSHAIPKRIRDAVIVACEGRRRAIDVGRATLTGADGSEQIRLFANHASCGLTGDVARRVNTTSKQLGGTSLFLWATVQAFRAWKNVPLRVRLDDDELELLGAAVVCANGRYLGGGMHLAPKATQDDGLLDVLVIGDVGKLDLARNVHRLYRGTLGGHPKVTERQAQRIRIVPAEPLPAELDGEIASVAADCDGGAIEFDVLVRRLTLLTP